MNHQLLGPGFKKPPTDCLPSGWKVSRLGEVARVVGGGRKRLTKEEHYRPSGYPAFSAAGQDGFVDTPEFDCSGVVLSSIGANCGRCFLAEGQWTTLANVQAILPNPTALDHRFLFYRVNREDYWTRSGSAQPFIKPSDIGNSWIAVPPIAEQARIAEVLDTLNEAISISEDVVAKLQSVHVATTRQLLEHGVDKNGVARNPSKGSSHAGWGVCSMMDLVELPSGQVDPRREPFSSWVLVAPDHMESSTGRLLEKVTARDQGAISGKYAFLPGDVLYSKIRPYLRKAVLADFQGLCSADVYPLRPREGVNGRFLLALILGERFSAFAESVSMRSGFPKINREELAEYRVAIPPLDEQNRIADLLLAADDHLHAEQANLAKLKSLRSGITSDLLTGRIRVPTGASAC